MAGLKTASTRSSLGGARRAADQLEGMQMVGGKTGAAIAYYNDRIDREGVFTNGPNRPRGCLHQRLAPPLIVQHDV
jgi:hypothetical protein